MSDKIYKSLSKTKTTIDLNELRKFLTENGFEVLELKQPHQHVVGTVKKDNTVKFFKLASSKQLGARLINEYKWYKIAAEKDLQSQLDIKIVKAFEKGEYGELFWFTSEYLENYSPISELPPGNIDVENIKNNFPLILDLLKKMSDFQYVDYLPYDLDILTGFMEKTLLIYSENWLNETGEPDKFKPLLPTIKKLIPKLKPTLVHNDFTPNHIGLNDGNYYMIDGERMSFVGFTHIDLSHMFYALYALYNRKDLAHDFLNAYFQKFELSTVEDIDAVWGAIAFHLLGVLKGNPKDRKQVELELFEEIINR